MEPLNGDDPAEIGGYRLRGRLGAGGMGRVYLAFTPGGRPVALKVVRPELGDDRAFRDRFRQEIAAAQRVHGLYTAQLLDGDPDAVPPWLVTAYVAGPSLQQAVADHGPLPVASVFALMAGVAEALQAIHAAGVVHRDLKPSNVLLAPDGPRVIDFGIARALEATALTRTGMRVGSPQFMAPEQVRGGAVPPAADVFALGSLAGYAALGRSPFGEGSETAVLYRVVHEDPDLDGCPRELRALIGRCLAKDPAARPTPAEIIGSCRARSAVKTVEFTESWLPPTITAEMTRHAVPASLPQPSPAPTAPMAAALLAAPDSSGQQAREMPWLPDTMPATARTLQASGPPPGDRRRLPRTTVIAGVAAAVLLVGLASYGGLALASRGNSDSPSRGASGVARQAHGTHHNTSLNAAARTQPSPSSAPFTCLLGTWRQNVEDVPSTVNGDNVLYAGGAGAKQTFRPDGINIIDYGDGTDYSVKVNGVTWTQIVKGSATMHYETQDGTLLTSNVSAHGSETILEAGAYNSGGPLTLNTQPDRYTCTGNSLHIFAPNGGSVELTRSTPPVPSSRS
jgi:serine/threonine protein kinase